MLSKWVSNFSKHDSKSSAGSARPGSWTSLAEEIDSWMSLVVVIDSWMSLVEVIDGEIFVEAIISWTMSEFENGFDWFLAHIALSSLNELYTHYRPLYSVVISWGGRECDPLACHKYAWLTMKYKPERLEANL